MGQRRDLTPAALAGFKAQHEALDKLAESVLNDPREKPYSFLFPEGFKVSEPEEEGRLEQSENPQFRRDHRQFFDGVIELTEESL